MDILELSEDKQQQRDDMLSFTIEHANINSGSLEAQGVAKVAESMRTYFDALGGESELQILDPYQQINQQGQIEHHTLGPLLRIQKRPTAPIQILLVGHMDTVFSATHEFQAVTHVSDAVLKGPGVTDMKGGIAVMCWGLKAFEAALQAQGKKSINIGWEVLLTPDEEIGSLSSSTILNERAACHQLGFVFEPAIDEAGTLAGARKGSGKFTLVMKGKAAHAGRAFSEGRNAIWALSSIIQKIYALNGQKKDVTINIGLIQGGEAVNIVPETCLCRLDVRVPDEESAVWVQTQLEKIVAENKEQEGFELQLHGKFGRPPKIMTKSQRKLYDMVQTVGAALGQTVQWQATGGCCDGNNLAAAGLPNIDTLGVRGGKIHSSEEYLIIDSLVERAQLLSNILWHIEHQGLP